MAFLFKILIILLMKFIVLMVILFITSNSHLTTKNALENTPFSGIDFKEANKIL